MVLYRKSNESENKMERAEKEQLLSQAFPFWGKLTKEEQEQMVDQLGKVQHKKGEIQYHGGQNCSGVEVIVKGRQRIFLTSPNGGEITLYRLLPGDVCILSAACMIKNLNLETHVEYEEDTIAYYVPKQLFKAISDQNAQVKEYVLELVSEKFSDVMWLFNQYMFTNMAKRLADALLEHRALAGSDQLNITHEILAKDLGTAREVVTRLLKQFQIDGIVHLSRGEIHITDMNKLLQI